MRNPSSTLRISSPLLSAVSSIVASFRARGCAGVGFRTHSQQHLPLAAHEGLCALVSRESHAMSSHGHGHSHGSSSSSASASSHGHGHGPSSSSALSSSHSHGHGSVGKKAEAKKADEKKPEPPAWPIFVKSVPYLWPRDSAWLRFCFVLSIVCLIIGSLADLYTPIAVREAVNELSGNVEANVDPVLPTRWILVYGIVRFLANLFQQLRDVFFAAVGAETERRVALETFNHLQSLSLSFHLKRETGAVLRSVSRGSQSFATLARIVLFQIAPIFLQLLVVCVYLASLYPWYFSFLTFVIIAAYFVFTFTTTNWRDRYRRRMNEADNEYNQKAVDALLNVSRTAEQYSPSERTACCPLTLPWLSVPLCCSSRR